MIIVLASRFDEAAKSLVGQWQGRGAALLTAQDLSAPGWRYHAGAWGSGKAVIGGQPVPVRDMAGVFTRAPGIYESELDHVVPDDRAYVAAEMNAFLLAWLSTLPCPVLNRPTPECLCGPGWRAEKWVRLAVSLGIPVEPIHRDSSVSAAACEDSEAAVTVVGQHCFGKVDPSLAGHARHLAAAAQVDLLGVRFTGPEHGSRFAGVNLQPEVSAPEMRDAILEYFRGAREC